MTVQINFIEGRRGSICTNDAYSVVAYEERVPSVLAFVPAAPLRGKSPEQISDIFAKAIRREDPALIAAVRAEAVTIAPRALAL